MLREASLDPASRFSSTWRARLLSDVDGHDYRCQDDVLEHDVDWLVAQCDRPDKKVLIVEHSGDRLVPFFLHDGQIDFDFGEFSFASMGVRRHVVVGNFPNLTIDDWVAAFEALRGQLSSNAAVFLLGVVQGEALEQALSSAQLRHLYVGIQHGPSYERRLCRLGKDLDEYLTGLASGRRQDLRRSKRRFEREFEGRYCVQVITDRADLEVMLDVLEPVSRRTYQARLRGLGLSRSGHTGREVLEGARRGFARCYLLLVDNRPIAWRIGFLYRGVYYSHHVGYDPDFENWHPGVVLHLASIEDLSSPGVRARVLDMLYGDNDFKRKAANDSRIESNYYLFPRSFRGRTTHALLSGCNRVSESAGIFLDRYGVKAKIKRWLRRR